MTGYPEEVGMTADDMWDFDTTPIDFDELAVELLAWIGQLVHVNPELEGGSGGVSLYGRLSSVAEGLEPGGMVLWFEGSFGAVHLDPSSMSAFRVTSPGSASRWLEFRVGGRRVLELILEDPELHGRRPDRGEEK
jgi:hypothetical protein